MTDDEIVAGQRQPGSGTRGLFVGASLWYWLGGITLLVDTPLRPLRLGHPAWWVDANLLQHFAKTLLFEGTALGLVYAAVFVLHRRSRWDANIPMAVLAGVPLTIAVMRMLRTSGLERAIRMALDRLG